MNRKYKIAWASVAFVSLLVLVLGCGTNNQAVPNGIAPSPGVSAPATSTAPVASSGLIGNGVWLVNVEIKPGSYQTKLGENDVCYWERLKGTSGTLDDVISNNVEQGPATVTVTIKKSDNAFRSNGCGVWKLR